MSLTKASYSMVNGAPVNVLDYGAKGDGVNDDAPAFQAAYDALIANGGGTLYVPPTSAGYKLNSSLNFTNGFFAVDMIGGGSANLPNNPAGGDDCLGSTLWLNSGDVGIDLTGCGTFGIQNITLDTNHPTKCPTPARIGILSARSTVSQQNQNHRFTNMSVFIKTSGSTTSPSIALYADNVELMTCVNTWFHGDIATVLTYATIYNVASPNTTISNSVQSATCNTFLSCKMISISGLGPALRVNQTVNNTIIGTYFGNAIDQSTYPAVWCTGPVQKLLIKGFQSEERTEFLKVSGNLIECEFYGTHASTSQITPIGNFDSATNVHNCKFDIYNSAVVTGYSAYTGTITYLANSYFNLGYGGNFAVTCTTFQGNNFNKLGAPAAYTGIPSVGSDATINGVYQPSFYVRKQDYAFQKTNATNNTQFVFASVVIPNSELNAIIEIPYTLNSADGQLIRTGRLRVNAARYGGYASVVTMSEEAAQVALQTAGTETITASFAIGSTSGATNATQTIQLATTINSSLGHAGYIRGIATVQSSYFTNGLVYDQIYVTSA